MASSHIVQLNNNVPLCVANGLRRCMLVDVPRLAFTEVTIFNNTTDHEDELIAQRLGLVPIESSKLEPFECEIDVTGRPVFFSDIHPLALPGDSELISLRPGQHLKCIVRADVGIGKTHAKWMSCTRAKYDPRTHILEFWTNQSLTPQDILNRTKTALLKKIDVVIYEK